MEKVYDFRNIVIVHNNDIVHSQGYMISACAISPLFGHIIFVDDYFLNSSEIVKKFIMLHEYMHIHHNISTSISRSIYNSYGMVDPGEYKVDEFVVKEIGKRDSLIAMKEMMKIPGINKLEIWKRKRHIKKLKEVE